MNISKQAGASLYMIMIFLMLFLFAVLFATKTAPAYFDHSLIQDIVKTLKDEPKIATMNKKQIYANIQRRLDMNGIRDFKNENITLEDIDGQRQLTIAYEYRANLVKNIDVVVRFNESVMLAGKGN
ncbi:MAG: hypothetical protein CMF25_07960 [Kangiellaceae bacterium]|jgi:hypothetical protein|nr:hypothetical protein [Kangiellaceae bacterium]|tara:strand:+ start:987 stop:1364 length:378 start_codon:yes stop_codon:yes gene_type:complete